MDTYLFNRIGTPPSCSGNGDEAYHIHHISIFGSDHSHHSYMDHWLHCSCSQCK